jgi:hypothetical protein
MAEGQEIDRAAELDPPRDAGVGGEQRQRFVDRVVKRHVVARPHRVEAELLHAPRQRELHLGSMQRQKRAKAKRHHLA